MKRNLLLSLLSFLPSMLAAETVNFNRDIRPVLSDRCFHCHGPDANDRKGKLRLDVADGPHSPFRKGGDTVSLVPGSLEKSELWYRIVTDDEDDVMPPADSHKKPLSAKEKALFKKWIEEGAEYEGFWAFEPIEKPEVPKVGGKQWGTNKIDSFVLRKLRGNGHSPKPRADKRTLVRRVSLDLTGLPPTRAEIREFLGDNSPDAYEKLVGRFLAKPQYGEHMTKYWLDLVRFADTNGIHHDHYRDLTPYRDWVIRAFNGNLPFDDFVKYQLAGDLYPEPSQDQLIASGLNRLHMIIDRGTRLPEESFARNVIDRVTSVGTAFMGMTVECAVCHDHKYDPMTMKDFYSLTAFFNNIDANSETGGRSGTDFRRGLQVPYINLPTQAQEAQLAKFAEADKATQAEIQSIKKKLQQEDAKAKKLQNEKKRLESAPKDIDEAGKENEAGQAKSAETLAAIQKQLGEVEKKKKGFQQKLKQAEAALKKTKGERDKLMLTIPGAMVMKERKEVRPTHILVRGDYQNPGEQVQRATPEFLPPMKDASSTPTRMDLAKWFVSGEQPLTARVTANRFWQQFLGVGIVKTSEDLGAQGEWPSHPDLLEYLAWSFRESGWDVKALVKEILMSETYRQSSEATPEEFHNDPENRLLARGSRYRLDSEIIRDQILATSGLLNPEMYGKSVKPPQPEGLWNAVSLPSSYPRNYVADTGDKIYRRSMYSFWKRGLPPPQMTILNAPTRESCVARRERTNTPLQALLLLNEREYMKAACHLAAKVLGGGHKDPVAVAYETITSQVPDKAEAQLLREALAGLEKQYEANSRLAGELTQGVPAEGIATPKLAAFAVLINSLYNLDITKTRQ